MSNGQEHLGLAPCDYRVAAETPDVFFCRHTSVMARGSRVTRLICRICSAREVPCENPGPVPDFSETIPPWTYLTIEDLMADTRRLLQKLPPGITAVCGVPRSGLLPATFPAKSTRLLRS